jgi:pimeloyl-ACP methyl ester carboxylesterase
MILNSEIIGTGNNLIVILHGLYGNSESWKQVAQFLKSDFTIHLVDQRNHGNSFFDDNHSYSDLVDDLKNYCKAHNLDKINLIGHSMGGKVAMFFAAKYPELINKIIIADISPRNYAALMDHIESIRFHLNLISKMKNMPIESFSLRSQVSQFLKNSSIEEKNIILKNLKKENNKFVWKININAIMNNLPEIMSGMDPDDFIENKIEVPALFLKSSNSNYINKSDIKLINFIFNQAQIQTIQNTSHWLHHEKPEETALHILNFLIKPII